MDSELKLIIAAERLPAVELAEILRALDRSFHAFVNRRNGKSLKAHLAVRAIEYGSIEIILDAIGSYEKLMLAAEFLGPFASHIAHLAGLSASGKLQQLGKEVSEVDRKALKSIVGPVANGSATQTNIIFNGDVTFHVGTMEDAKTIIQGLKNIKTERRSGEDEVIRTLAPESVTAQQINKLEEGKLIGTVFLVNNEWYARLQDGQGVLVPISPYNDVLPSFSNGKVYTFLGRPVRGLKGETIGITVEQATPIT